MYFTMFSEEQESHIYSGDMFLIPLFWESTHNDRSDTWLGQQPEKCKPATVEIKIVFKPLWQIGKCVTPVSGIKILTGKWLTKLNMIKIFPSLHFTKHSILKKIFLQDKSHLLFHRLFIAFNILQWF